MVCFSPMGYGEKYTISTFADQTHIQRTRPRRKTVFLKTSLSLKLKYPTEAQMLIVLSYISIV